MAVIALDIGGTKIKAGIVSKKGLILSSIRIPTNPSQGKAKLTNLLKTIIQSLISGSRHKISAIGISLPGLVDSHGKVIACGSVLSFFVGVNLKSILESKFDLPVSINNDSLCFTITESSLGSGVGKNSVLGVIWGSGVGAGIVKKHDGRVIPELSFPVEFGHSFVYDYRTKKYIKLELICGGAFLTKRYAKFGGKIKNPSVGQIYNSKEKIAKELISESIELMGRGISNLVNIFNPDVVVLGGGVSNLPKPVYDKLFFQLKKYSLPTHFKNLSLKRFQISDDEGLLGAAHFAFSLGK